MVTTTKTKQVTLNVTADQKAMPRIIIVGRGQSHGRKMYAWRYKQSIIDRLEKMVEGPTYLAVELAVTRFLDDLEKHEAGNLEIVRAETLG